MTYAETLIARRRADDALLAKPLADRIAYLVGMSIMEPAARHDTRFDAFLGVQHGQDWRVSQACLRSDANVHRELLADRLFRSIQRDGGADDLRMALTLAHYTGMADELRDAA